VACIRLYRCRLANCGEVLPMTTTTTRNPHPAVERLIAVQRARGWPDHVVAELLGISSEMWRHYRRGGWPRPDRIWRVAEVAARVSAEEAQP
jgi:hypothetical protein